MSSTHSRVVVSCSPLASSTAWLTRFSPVVWSNVITSRPLIVTVLLLPALLIRKVSNSGQLLLISTSFFPFQKVRLASMVFLVEFPKTLGRTEGAFRLKV